MPRNPKKKQTVKKNLPSKKIKKAPVKAKKPAAKAKIKPSTKTSKKPSIPKKTKKKTASGMDHCQQCVLLAAIINQKSISSADFRAIPLPDINSSAFATLREQLAEFPFTYEGIREGAKALVNSQEFKKIFPIKEKNTTFSLPLSKKESKQMVQELLEISGPEARRTFYINAKNPRDIHKATLEKYALETGHIDALPQHELKEKTGGNSQKINNFMPSHINRRDNQFAAHTFSSRQKRGRG